MILGLFLSGKFDDQNHQKKSKKDAFLQNDFF